MIAIPSPSFSEGEVCSHISNWLTDKGIVHERVGNNIIARLSEQPGVNTDAFDGKPTLMLCAHIDTVSASEDYSFDPYSPDYKKAAEVISAKIANGELPEAPSASVDEGDIVAGLGSNDDGASVVSMIATFRYFISSAINTDLILVLSCEEERSGVNGMTGLWESALCCAKQTNCADTAIKVDYAIVGEPTGMRAATAERGLLVIDATAHGISGHAARNEGVNAIDIAIKDIEAIKAHTFTRLSPRMGRVNLNVTQINAGTAHNVIPDTCTFVIDIRPTEQYTNEEILAELQSICKSDLKPRNLKNQSSATHEDSPLQSTAESLGIETFSSPTTSDWMRIDCDAIKMGPGNSARSHRKDEFVFTSEIEGGISTYIRFIEGLSTKV
jgi:acetylornithine deacetylase